MGAHLAKSFIFTVVCMVACGSVVVLVRAQLSPSFYAESCPNLELIVRSAMTQAVAKDATLGASMLRLFFHDCFVNKERKQACINATFLQTAERKLAEMKRFLLCKRFLAKSTVVAEMQRFFKLQK
ncbi:hypothetical protein ZIOFF_047523 [Zingiber officinale]|uniref:Plant heme peroxidase family profile domain-containing protein n=1 Tax=Zingiber officinale TaxID=94328 RepID=A0A8J5KTR3_ZINOF|nr:hypothetical protein ZIOFF_047523 [Zingiber officinale]